MCTTPFTNCSGHGVCNALSGCQCEKGFTGLYCQTVAPPSKSSGNAGAVAGGVIAALAVVGIAGACYFYRVPIKARLSRVSTPSVPRFGGGPKAPYTTSSAATSSVTGTGGSSGGYSAGSSGGYATI